MSPDESSPLEALAQAGVGHWSWDRTTGRVLWDDQVERLFGLDPGTFEETFEGWSSRLHPDDRGPVEEAVERTVRHRTPLRLEHRCVWPDGSIHWLECRGTVTVADDEVTGVTGVVMSIDDRRAAEEGYSAIAEERSLLRSVQETGDKLARLHAVAVSLAGAATVQDIAETLVHQGADSMGAEGGFFSIVDHTRQKLDLLAQHGARREVAEFYRSLPLDASTPAAEAAASGTPVYVNSHEDRRRQFPALPDQGAAAFVIYPILLDRVVRAVLAFGYSEPHEFTAHEEEFLATLVGMSRQALDRALLHDATSKAAARASQLESITTDLAGATSRRAVARIVVEHLIPAVGAQKGSLYVRDESTNALHSLAILGYSDEVVEHVGVLPLDEPSGPSDALRSGTVLVVDGPEDFARRWPHLASRFGTDGFPETSVMLPLVVDGSPIGTIGISYDERHLLTDEEMRHLSIMAGICAQALGRAMAFEESETARRRLRAIDQISDAALSRLSLADLLAELPPRIAAALDCEAVRIFLKDETGGNLEVRGHHGSPGDELARVPVGRGLAGRIAATGRPRVIEDITKHEVITPAFPAGVVSEAGVPLRSGGEVIGVLDVGAGPDRPLSEGDLELLELAADRIAAAIDRGNAFELERTARRHSDLMARLVEMANRPGTLEGHLASMVRLLQESLADFAVAVVAAPENDVSVAYSSSKLDEEDAALHSIAATIEEGRSATATEILSGGLGRILESGSLESTDPDLAAATGRLGTSGLILVPLRALARTVGVLVLGRRQERFLPSELLLVNDFSARMGTAIESRIAFDRLRSTAMTLQQSLLPARLPEVAGLDLAARYWPASENYEVGGDFYDVIPIDAHRWGLIVGDVSGKGISASAMTGVARHTARAAARHGIAPVETLRWIHEAFHEQVETTEVFCTAVFGVLDELPSGFEFSFAIGGHPLPICRREAEAAFVGTPGTVLGLVDEVEFTESRVRLAEGDWLVIYTDGVTDVPVANAITEDELLRIVESACETDCTDAIEAFDRILKERYGDAHNRDDTAVLVIRCGIPSGSGAEH